METSMGEGLNTWQKKTPKLCADYEFIVYEEYTSMYSWHLNTGVRSTDPLCSWKSMCSFWFSQNLTINSPLLTRSITNNVYSRLTHIFYVICMIYHILTIKQTKENIIQKIIWKNTAIVFTEKDPYISGSAQFKPVMTKGQQQFEIF